MANNKRVFIVCDIGTNFLGDIDLAKQLIKWIKEAGADAVKPQLWEASKLYDKSHKYWSVIKSCQLSFEQAQELFKYGKSIGLEVFFSVFDIERIKWCEEIGVKRYKVAAQSANDDELLKAIAKTDKPAIISISNRQDVDLYKIDEIFSLSRYDLLYCISIYPPEDCDLNLMQMSYRIGPKGFSGFSDHTTDTLAALAAATLGASIIEKHVLLDESYYGETPDSVCSITVDMLKQLVIQIRRMEVML